MSDVKDTLEALRAGGLTLEQAAGRFRTRTWPVKTAGPAGGWPDGDPEPEPEGGFGEVEAAYTAGLITGAQYETLAHAAADAMHQQQAPAALQAKNGPGGGRDQLVGMLAAHDARVIAGRLPGWAAPGAHAALAVYDRGEQSWPGETKTLLSRQEWAAGRVAAFLDLAAGDGPDGYRRDIDLLPEGHPARDPGDD